MTSVDSNFNFCVDVHKGLDPLPVHMRPPKPDSPPPPCGRHKWMAPCLECCIMLMWMEGIGCDHAPQIKARSIGYEIRSLPIRLGKVRVVPSLHAGKFA